METVLDAWNAPALPQGAVVTIGNFDGIHIGQRAVLEHVRERAAALDASACVITFEPHPMRVVRPDRAPLRLTTLEQKQDLLVALGIDVLLVVRFDREFARTSAEAFVRSFLVERLGVREVHVGAEFGFGRGREGNLSLLRRLGDELGFSAQGVEEVEVEGLDVSSTRIRSALLEGDVALATTLLGRPYEVRGRVVVGDGRGRDLGWPTINLETANELTPRLGVYVVGVSLQDVATVRGGVANVGVRPTFAAPGSERAPQIEAHILDFDEEVYDRSAALHFLGRLRGEKRFRSAEQLASQIGRDVKAAREFLRREVCLSDLQGSEQEPRGSRVGAS